MSIPLNNTSHSKKTKKIISISILAALLILSTGSGLIAQEQTSPKKKEPFLMEQVHTLGLDSLKKGRTTIHFSAGYQKQAIKLGRRTEKALQFFLDSLDVGLKEFHLILADKKDWKKLAEFPYGQPIWGLGGWQKRNLRKQVNGRPPSTIIPAAQKLFPAESPGETLSEKTEAVYNNMDSMSEEKAARRLKKINTELISRLEEIAPGFKAWADGFSEIEKSQ